MAAILFGLALLGACGDDDEASPATSSSLSTSTAAATGFTTPATPAITIISPAGSPPPEMPAFREFAAQVAAAIDARDPTFFTSRAQLTEMTCRGDEQLGPCAGAAPGEVLSGIFGAAWQSDASALFSIEDYRLNLERYFEAPVLGASDAYGPSTVRLFALAYRGGESPVFLAIASGILDVYPSTGYPIGESQRESHAFRFTLQGSDWRFAGEIVAGLSVVSSNWLSGKCAECYDYFELWQGDSD